MADKQIMNTGWHQWRSYDYPSNGFGPMWQDSMNNGFRLLFDFRWLDQQNYLRYEYFPAITRERGMENLGGKYEYTIFDFDPLTIEQDHNALQLALLDLAVENKDAPQAAPDFNVLLHGGQFSNEGLHWVEMYNPLTFQREHLSDSKFEELAIKLMNQAEAALQQVREVVPEFEAQWVNLSPWRQEEVLRHAISSSLLLANQFAAKRIPFDSLLMLRLVLPDYAWVYSCVTDLPNEANVQELGLNRLKTLYAT